jgi:hypothetical protein
MRILATVLFFCCCLSCSFAQKFLIIERAGSVRTERIALYEEITFKLKDDDKGWYTRQILDLNADAQMVLLGDTWVPLNEISSLFLKRKRVLATVLGGALQGGGASMILGDAYYTIRGTPEYTQGGMEFGALNILLGTGIRALLEPVRFKLGKKKRLRVIDITFRSNDKT